jgi:hypothetical protein
VDHERYFGDTDTKREYLRWSATSLWTYSAVAERLRQPLGRPRRRPRAVRDQVKVLLGLVPGAALPMRSLAERLDYDASNLTTLVDRLQQCRAVERRPDLVDCRVKAPALTLGDEQLRQKF